MANLNGQLILTALQTLEEPSSLKNVVTTIAKTCGLAPDQIQETVKRTLNGGVQHGYVQCANRRYYTAEYDAEEKTRTNGNDEEPPEDNSKRRRRSASRRRRRSGSRRRSRRRRSRRRRSRR